jgi:hypothetical protein
MNREAWPGRRVIVSIDRHEKARSTCLFGHKSLRTNHGRSFQYAHLEQLKDLGAGRPASAEVARLYHQGFREFGTQALWSRRPSDTPTIAQALVIAESRAAKAT